MLRVTGAVMKSSSALLACTSSSCLALSRMAASSVATLSTRHTTRPPRESASCACSRSGEWLHVRVCVHEKRTQRAAYAQYAGGPCSLCPSAFGGGARWLHSDVLDRIYACAICGAVVCMCAFNGGQELVVPAGGHISPNTTTRNVALWVFKVWHMRIRGHASCGSIPTSYAQMQVFQHPTHKCKYSNNASSQPTSESVPAPSNTTNMHHVDESHTMVMRSHMASEATWLLMGMHHVWKKKNGLAGYWGALG